MAVKMAQAEKMQVKDALKPEKGLLTKQEVELVDEMVALDAQLVDARPKLKRFEEIKKVLASVSLDSKRFDLDKPARLEGTVGSVEFKEQSHPREITDMHGLIGALKAKMGGYEKMLPVIKINLGDVDTYLTEAEAAPFVKNVDGSRAIKGVIKK